MKNGNTLICFVLTIIIIIMAIIGFVFFPELVRILMFIGLLILPWLPMLYLYNTRKNTDRLVSLDSIATDLQYYTENLQHISWTIPEEIDDFKHEPNKERIIYFLQTIEEEVKQIAVSLESLSDSVLKV